MKIKLVIELDDRTRRAIAAHQGAKGKASYAMCKTHLEVAINGDLEDVTSDYDKGQENSEQDD